MDEEEKGEYASGKAYSMGVIRGAAPVLVF